MSDQAAIDEHWVARAIELATTSGSKFGAVIVDPKGGIGEEALIAESANSVIADRDPTAHAEVNAIRKACAGGRFPLAGLTLYASAEPCPMCAGAIAWSGIRRLVFGAPIEDIAARGTLQIDVKAATILDRWTIPVEVVGGVLLDDARAVFGKPKR